MPKKPTPVRGSDSPSSKESEPSPEGEGSGDQKPTSSPEGGAPSSEPVVDPETGGQTGFTNPYLRERSPQDIERMFSALQSEVRNTGIRNNELERELAARGSGESEGGNDDELEELALKNPLEATRRVVRRELEDIIQPFRENLAATTAQTARQRVANEFDDWGEVEPLVDYILRNTGQPENENTLRASYYTALGMRERGVFANMGHPARGTGPAPVPTSPPAPTSGGRPAPPQNRPSPAPVAPSPRSSEPPELTEEERRIAREWGMSHEEYVAMRELEPHEVATSKVGLEAS